MHKMFFIHNYFEYLINVMILKYLVKFDINSLFLFYIHIRFAELNYLDKIEFIQL